MNKVVVLLFLTLFLISCNTQEDTSGKEQQINIWEDEIMDEELSSGRFQDKDNKFHISWENTYRINKPRIHKIKNKYFGYKYYYSKLNDMTIRPSDSKNKREQYRINKNEYLRIINLDEISYKKLTEYDIDYS